MFTVFFLLLVMFEIFPNKMLPVNSLLNLSSPLLVPSRSLLVWIPGRTLGEALPCAVWCYWWSHGYRGALGAGLQGRVGLWHSVTLSLEAVLRKVSREVTVTSGGLRPGSDFLQFSGS